MLTVAGPEHEFGPLGRLTDHILIVPLLYSDQPETADPNQRPMVSATEKAALKRGDLNWQLGTILI
jgi:hypothetical protein